MTPREIVIDAIRHRHTSVVPYTLAFEGDVAERLDRHYGGHVWRQRLVPYMANIHAVATDHKDPIDATHNRDLYGGIWRTDQRPWHLETPPLTAPTFDGYAFPKPEAFFRLENKNEWRARCESQGTSFRLAHLGWGLFERSWTLRGFENALTDAVAEPEFYAELLDRLMELYLAFVDYTVDLPVDGVLFGDDWGDQQGVIIGPQRWRELLKPRWARIYDRVHAAGKLVFGHSCGSVADIIPDLIEIGLDVLESCQPEARGMNPYELKRRWGDKLAFWGCLGSQHLLPFGTPAEIRAEVVRLRREMARGGGFILAPAKPLQPETPTENAVALVEALFDADAR